jgi:hypothetical protein
MDKKRTTFHVNYKQPCIGGMFFGFTEVTMEDGWWRVEFSNVSVGENNGLDRWKAALGEESMESDL